MGHLQPPTPIQTDNTTTEGVLNSRVQTKQMKSMDMQLHWLLCREAQSQFRFYWRPGKTNLADYFMDHRSPAHHRNMRAELNCITVGEAVARWLQGCVKLQVHLSRGIFHVELRQPIKQQKI